MIITDLLNEPITLDIHMRNPVDSVITDIFQQLNLFLKSIDHFLRIHSGRRLTTTGTLTSNDQQFMDFDKGTDAGDCSTVTTLNSIKLSGKNFGNFKSYHVVKHRKAFCHSIALTVKDL